MSSNEPAIAISAHQYDIQEADLLEASQLIASLEIEDSDDRNEFAARSTDAQHVDVQPGDVQIQVEQPKPKLRKPKAAKAKVALSKVKPVELPSTLDTIVPGAVGAGDLVHVDLKTEMDVDTRVKFSDFNLPAEICSALLSSGYEYPTAIQAATIPAMLEGRDVLGQAQTGTGKTAAFALPLLSRINIQNPATQVLVLAPTRELAIQVSEFFQRYAQHMRGLRVAPIYGGQAYATQIHALQRGVHVVVGTPGRVMDHMRENRLRVDTLQCLVLDEADEMLRMGFVDDVKWIVEQTPAHRQIALFSATMPSAIREIADQHLKNPHVISIASQQKTADNIRQ